MTRTSGPWPTNIRVSAVKVPSDLGCAHGEMKPEGSSGKFPSFSFEVKEPAPTPRPTLQNALALAAPSSRATGGAKEHVVAAKPSNPWYYLDSKGDFKVFNYDGKLDANQIPRYRRQNDSPLGFPRGARAVFDPAGGFSPAVSKPEPSSRQPRIFEWAADEFTPTLHFQLENQCAWDPEEAFVEFSPVEELSDNLHRKEASLARRRLDIEKTIHFNPKNVDAWLELIEMQDALKMPCRVVTERKIAICEKALVAVGQNLALTRLYIDLHREICNPQECLKMWEVVVASTLGQNSLDCGFAHIEFYVTRCASIFSVLQAIEMYLTLARKIGKYRGDAHPAEVDAARVRVLTDLVALLAHSGHIEQAAMLVLFAGQAPREDHTRVGRKLRSSLTIDIPVAREELSWMVDELLILLRLESEEDLLEFDKEDVDCIREISSRLSVEEVVVIWSGFLEALGMAIPRPGAKLWRIELSARERTFKRLPESWCIFKPSVPLTSIDDMVDCMPASLREKRDHFRIALAQIHAHVSGSRDAENYLQGILAREPTNWALWDAYASILRLGERQREAEKVYAKLLNSGLITSSSWRLSICEGYCELLWQRECYDAIAEQLTKCCLGESGALPLSAASVLKIKKIISTSANNAEHLTALLESAISRIPQLPSTAPTSSKRMKNPNLCTSSVNDLQRLAALVQRGRQTEAESLLFSLMDKHPYQLCPLLDVAVTMLSKGLLDRDQLSLVVAFFGEKGCMVSEYHLAQLLDKL